MVLILLGDNMISNKMCHYCICQHCNMKRCRWHLLLNRCLWCMENLDVPTIECDRFEFKYIRKVYRIKRKGVNRLTVLMDRLEKLFDKMDGAD